jgi:succinyl-diaminopimelate desuccinylase
MSDTLSEAVLGTPSDDLFALAAALVDVPSESHHEAHLCDLLEQRLAARAPSLDCVRVANNLIVRTDLGRERRVVLGGHLDTVPANGNERARIEGDVLHGLGAADMKGSLAVLLALAERLHAAPDSGPGAPEHDVTFAFYEGEEVSDQFNGLRHVFEERARLLDADFAVLLEPTDGWVEAGCQGFLIVRAEFDGERAHTARPWMGRNAIHRASDALARVAAHESDTVLVDGLEFRESLQTVRIEGGVLGKHNVVPDSCALVVNRRFAPAYTAEEAFEQVRALVAGPEGNGADRVEVLQAQPAAAPNLANPLVAEFVQGLGLPVRPKLGWTDVARFASRGVPAVNFGAGDPTIAHTAGEHVTRESVERCHEVLARFVGVG